MANPLQETVFRTVWLLLNDEKFIQQVKEVPAGVFPKGTLRYLVNLSLRNWKKHHTLLTASVVNASADSEPVVLRRCGAEAARVKASFPELCEKFFMDDPSLPSMRELCTQWLERRIMSLSLEKAGQAMEQGQLEQARAILTGTRLQIGADDGEVTRISAKSPDILNIMRTPKQGAVPTGLKELDELWEGGYREGELGMIVAPTGVGKSMMLCLMAAEAFWAGASCLYYTFELTVNQIQDRVALAILQKGKQSTHGTWDDELRRAARVRGVPVPASVIDVRSGSKTWPDILNDLEEHKAEFGKYPDVLFLDSADDVAPLTKADSLHESLRAVFVFLRAQAQEKKIRIWTTGQLNREAVEKARVSLRYIGDAFAKAQKSHYVIGFAQTDTDRNDVDGPIIQVYGLKDSLYGSTGLWLECKAMFGRGANGYPGFEVLHNHVGP